jgi:hypothetical protein
MQRLLQCDGHTLCHDIKCVFQVAPILSLSLTYNSEGPVTGFDFLGISALEQIDKSLFSNKPNKQCRWNQSTNNDVKT